MRQGDFVLRKSYGGDVLFRIEDILDEHAVLKGVEFRLLADSPLEDLVPIGKTDAHKHLIVTKNAEEHFWGKRENYMGGAPKWPESQTLSGGAHFDVPGKVLHLDGDRAYLQKCMPLYQRLNIPAKGFFVSEKDMAKALYEILPRIRPDILVITGHDGLLKKRQHKGQSDLSNYKNSANFVKAVQTARLYDRNRDSLIIIAGACQSHFEALLAAGANFASSPARTLIHALDPLYVACKIALTSIRDTINISDVIKNTVSGSKGIGGIETRGSFRIGYPEMKGTEEQKMNFL